MRILGSAVLAYCSQRCREDASAPTDAIEEPPPPRPWWRTPLHVGLGLMAAVQLSGGTVGGRVATPRVARTVAVPAPEPLFGPEWPPSDEDLRGELAADAWLHPLAGPVRKMPISHARVFGADRPGERPPECRSGHCGVDLGDAWGELVYAAHDGVVDRVQRGPNEDHGGLYVRLAHRNATVFSQYFHLAGIPKWIQPGRTVKAGTVLGVIGDTGIKESKPHLHFTISVKPSRETHERFMDPEPLIALWPLPAAGGASIVTQAAPGLPVGAAPHRKKKSKPPLTTADAR